MTKPTLLWDKGTAYDLFVSLHILHKPERFGLRLSWAAGIRSRFPANVRKTLEQAQNVVSLPLLWVSSLPAPKDAESAIQALRNTPPRERLTALLQKNKTYQEPLKIFHDIAQREVWQEEDKIAFQEATQDWLYPPKAADIPEILDIWTQPGLFGEQYLTAIETYYKVFFAEEEKRIAPALASTERKAQAQAEELAFPDLIESLSHGVRLDTAREINHWVFVPSYWITPLVVYQQSNEEQALFLFGGRPEEESLIPGDQVPDSMLRALKTLANPTRLKILRYLNQENLAPTELAQRLRLRAPTVTHHLKKLRLAGLVYLTLSEKKKKYYASRTEAVTAAFDALQAFLNND